MNIRIDNEWLRWGDADTNYIGFFSPITEANEHDGMIYVTCKYGKYSADPKTQKVTTIEGIDYDTLVEVGKYGMGYKYWEANKPAREDIEKELQRMDEIHEDQIKEFNKIKP